MNITIAVNVSGTLDADDKRAMITRIADSNRLRRTPLPFDTAANIKTSYETILREGDLAEHLTNIENASTATGLQFNGFSEGDLKTIRRALADKAQSGRSIASLVTAIQAI